ncbi:MAG: sugar phosphate isomerase/epimerase [Planctomycetota bacterium]|nr:sugar phosphate isomerase/epimerase [Planctomycetota bacterium]
MHVWGILIQRPTPGELTRCPSPRSAANRSSSASACPATCSTSCATSRPPGTTASRWPRLKDPAKVREVLAETGLRVAGTHISYFKLDEFPAFVRFCSDFGAKLLMVSCTGDRAEGAASYRKASKVLNEYGRRARDAGLTLCYHNHSWEFKEVFDGVSGMRILLEETDPQHVKCCFDTYWVADGGEDVVAYLTKHRERIGMLHLKDRKGGTFTEVGAGELDWPGIFKAIEPLNLPWVVTEKDRTEIPAAESAKLSRAYLKSIGI